ncbi:SDR family oxidoreductase [Niabella terrae]
MSYVLITGGAKGIGAAIAIEFAKERKGLILVDKDERNLRELGDYIQKKFFVDVVRIVQDLAEPEAVGRVFQLTKWYHSYIDTVINNAGYGLNCSFDDLDIDRQLQIIDVNIKAQVEIAHAFIPVLERSSRSFLLNVAGLTSFFPVPYLAVYAASNSFIHSFSRSLQYELRDRSIHVSCLIPGATNTALDVGLDRSEHSWKWIERFTMSPHVIARAAVAGLRKNKTTIIPGWHNKGLSLLSNIMPTPWAIRIAAFLYAPRRYKAVIRQMGAFSP